MLDTIILKIPSNHVNLPDMQGNDFRRWSLQGRNGAFERFVNNPTPADKASGDYFPRLTAIHQGTRTEGDGKFLKVEFSAPKLLYGNNVDELSEADFPQVLSRLQDRMKRMGAYVFTKHIEESAVTAFHPSKNFLLSDGFTASHVIGELNRIGLPRRLDMSKVTFSNEGKSLQMYSIAHSLVFYDKVADLVKTKGRAVDKDRTVHQSNLFESRDLHSLPVEILRMEVRLSKKQKMNAVLTRLGHTKDPTFRDIFSRRVCQSVLLDYWQSYVGNSYSFLLDQASAPQATLRSMLKRGLKPKDAIYLLGLDALSRDTPGIIGLRENLSGSSSTRTWFRYHNDIRRLNQLRSQPKSSPHGWYRQIECGLSAMAPFASKCRHALTP